MNHYQDNLYKSIKSIAIFENEYIDYLINGKRLKDPQSFDSKSFHYITIIKLIYWLPYVIFAVILLAVTILPIFLKHYRHDNTMARCNSSLPDRRAIFFTIFEDRVRREFKTQSADTMSTIVNAVSHILLKNPERPSVLLLLSFDDEGRETSSKIAKATASAVLSSFQKSSKNIDKLILDSSNYSSTNEFWQFYEDVSNRINRYKLVIIEQFEIINPQVATAICHLADDTYSPFPQSIIIVSLNIGNRFNSNDLKNQAPVILAETFLEEKWNGVIEELLINELFARLTGRTVLIKKEEEEEEEEEEEGEEGGRGGISLHSSTTGSSLPSIKQSRYYGPSSNLRRRRQIARQ